MQDDLYAILGVKKTATAEDIKKAYRKLARETHPDANPDNPAAKARFVRVSAAYDILKDPARRARYDAGEIDATGAERTAQASGWTRARSHAGAGPFPGDGWSFDTAGDFADVGDLFAEIFRQRRRGAPGSGRFAVPGADQAFAMEIGFLEAARGLARTVTLPDGRSFDVRIPAGFGDGQTLRLKGKGGAGVGGAPAGDLLITVSVKPHPVFRREGDDILVTLPIGIDEAVLGGKVRTPTIDGPVNLTIPAGADSGQVLRLKGRGIARPGAPRGDQRVELKIVTPAKPDPALTAFLETWRKDNRHDPRKGLFHSQD